MEISQIPPSSFRPTPPLGFDSIFPSFNLWHARGRIEPWRRLKVKVWLADLLCFECECCVCLYWAHRTYSTSGARAGAWGWQIKWHVVKSKIYYMMMPEETKTLSLFRIASSHHHIGKYKFSLEMFFLLFSTNPALAGCSNYQTEQVHTHYNSFIFYSFFSLCCSLAHFSHNTRYNTHSSPFHTILNTHSLSSLLLFWIRFMSELCREHEWKVRFRRDERTALYYERTIVSCNGRR